MGKTYVKTLKYIKNRLKQYKKIIKKYHFLQKNNKLLKYKKQTKP